MRTGLAKDLDEALEETLPAVLEPAGFRRVKRRVRLWERAVDGAAQLVALWVDGRFARDGFLSVSVRVGVTYPGEEGRDAGPYFAHRTVAHQLSGLDRRRSELGQEWRVHEGDGRRIAHEVSVYVEQIAVPSLDRWSDPRRLRDHYVSRGLLHQAADLSAAVGDTAAARELARLHIEWMVYDLLTHESAPRRTIGGRALALAAEHDLDLGETDRALLLDDLRASVALWRTVEPYPDWVADYERRFLGGG